MSVCEDLVEMHDLITRLRAALAEREVQDRMRLDELGRKTRTLAEREAQVAAMKSALTALSTRLREIEKDSGYGYVWSLSIAHGFRYSGPTWEQPLKDAEEILSAAGQGGER